MEIFKNFPQMNNNLYFRVDNFSIEFFENTFRSFTPNPS